MPNDANQHTDIRWNPELQEWFCAKCGATSDHAGKEDAAAELAAFECNLFGANAKKVSDQERDLRAYHLARLRKEAND